MKDNKSPNSEKEFINNTTLTSLTAAAAAARTAAGERGGGGGAGGNHGNNNDPLDDDSVDNNLNLEDSFSPESTMTMEEIHYEREKQIEREIRANRMTMEDNNNTMVTITDDKTKEASNLHPEDLKKGKEEEEDHDEEKGNDDEKSKEIIMPTTVPPLLLPGAVSVVPISRNMGRDDDDDDDDVGRISDNGNDIGTAAATGNHNDNDIGTEEVVEEEVDTTSMVNAQIIDQDELEAQIIQQHEENIRRQITSEAMQATVVRLEDKEEDSGTLSSSFLQRYAAVLACLIVVVIVIVVVVVLGGDGNNPTSSPTIIVTTLAPSQSRLSVIQDLVTNLSKDGNSSLPVTNSPQDLALQWLVNDDEAIIDVSMMDQTTRDRLITRFALSILFYALKGESWATNPNFLSSNHECDWRSIVNFLGVECDSNQQVVSLYLPNNILRGQLPTEIGLLTRLGRLNLSGAMGLGTNLKSNTLTGTIPTTIGQLTNLIQFDLSHNQLLGGTIPTQIGMLTNLVELRLNDNRFVGTIPSEIGDLPSLTYVSLANNQLSGETPSSFTAIRCWSLEANDNITCPILLRRQLQAFVDLETCEVYVPPCEL